MDEGRYHTLIDKLYAAHLDSFIRLPEIAVIGDTSSGKSSLLSSIVQIEFPTHHTLTTRCPIRLRLKIGPPSSTSATVGITWQVTSKYSAAYPLVTTNRLEDIASEILKAQNFILSQSKTDIAKDIVDVVVTGKSSIEMTVIDLPGFVQSTGRDERTCMITEIRELVREYIADERCIVVAVHPANVDFHNSIVLSEANNVDPAHNRTIPVITKPDLVDEGSEGEVIELLNGGIMHKYPLGLHIVKCRSQKAVNVGNTLTEGLLSEEEFFKQRKPWCFVSDDIRGVPALRQKLARVQLRMIIDSVPTILREINVRAVYLSRQVQDLGEPLSSIGSQRQFWNRLLFQVTHELQAALNGKRFDRNCFQKANCCLPKYTSNKRVRLEGFEFQSNVNIIENSQGETSGHSPFQRQYAGQNWCSSINSIFSDFKSGIESSTLATIGKVLEGSLVTVHMPNGDEREGRVIKIRDEVVFVNPSDWCSTDDRFFSGRGKQFHLRDFECDGTSKIPQKNDVGQDDNGTVYLIRSVEPVVLVGQIGNNVGTKVRHTAKCPLTSRTKLSSIPMSPAHSYDLPDNTSVSDEREVLVDQHDSKQDNHQYSCHVDTFAEISAIDVRRSSSWLIEYINRSRTLEFNNFQHSQIFGSLIQDNVASEWTPLAEDLCDQAITLLGDLVDDVLSATIPRDMQKLRLHFSLRMREHLMAIGNLCKQTVRQLLDCEEKPFTQDKGAQNSSYSRKLQSIQRRIQAAVAYQVQSQQLESRNNHSSARRGEISIESGRCQERQATQHAPVVILSQTQSPEFMTVSDCFTTIESAFDQMTSQSIESLMAEDLLLMLDAYGSIAMKRVIDYVPMVILRHLSSIETSCFQFDIDDTELGKLLCEDESKVEKRTRVINELSTLRAAAAIIEKL